MKNGDQESAQISCQTLAAIAVTYNPCRSAQVYLSRPAKSSELNMKKVLARLLVGDQDQAYEKQIKNFRAQPITPSDLKSRKFHHGILCSRCQLEPAYAGLNAWRLFDLSDTSGAVCQTCFESLRCWWAAGKCDGTEVRP